MPRDRFEPILTVSERQQEACADTEARWQQIEAMMRCQRWKRAELARRFFEKYADEIAG